MTGKPPTERRVVVRRDDGFTLMELMVVILILGILVSVSAGTYFRMQDRGEQSAAELNVREALSATELYYAHHDTYSGMTKNDLEQLDAGVRLSREPVVAADGKSYCLESTHNGNPSTAAVSPGHNVHSLTGPGGDVVAGPCPSSL
jgi:prepilin-type N-terminal cleavage/methylation domain-containing protein